MGFSSVVYSASVACAILSLSTPSAIPSAPSIISITPTEKTPTAATLANSFPASIALSVSPSRIACTVSTPFSETCTIPFPIVVAVSWTVPIISLYPRFACCLSSVMSPPIASYVPSAIFPTISPVLTVALLTPFPTSFMKLLFVTSHTASPLINIII
nr:MULTISPECIES: hypothetical protein [unclassified Bacillus (in: firmicutes)]